MPTTALEFLSLSSNAIGDEGLKGIAQGVRQNAYLRRLDLYFNKVSNAGVVALGDALGKGSALRMVHLDSNFVGDEGAASLAKALARGAPIGEMTLAYNRLTSEGASVLAAAAKASSSLHAFTIDHNQMAEGTEGAAAAKELAATDLKERAELAVWLVGVGLADFMGAEGPPLLSPYAEPVRALNVHTASGLLEHRHSSAEQLTVRCKELRAARHLSEVQRAKLVDAILQKVQEASASTHDEL